MSFPLFQTDSQYPTWICSQCRQRMTREHSESPPRVTAMTGGECELWDRHAERDRYSESELDARSSAPLCLLSITPKALILSDTEIRFCKHTK